MQSADPSAWVVHKFGGSSVADAECFKRVANILETLPPGRLGIVLSACRCVTDALLGLVSRAEAQDDGIPGFAKNDYLDEEAFWGQVERARELAVDIVDRMRKGDVKHDPKSGDCPTWCELWSMCRVRRA